MKYRYSHVDQKNLKWFTNDVSRSTLTKIELRRGKLRGLFPCKIHFQYPLSVIAGKNGSGKSTILALAACAYHNTPEGFSLPGRRLSYYTMSDFFLQSAEEVAADGINIWYEFLHDNWSPSPRVPKGVGRAWQSRTKRKGGKWSHYSRRVDRNVAFFGIERVVPHSERSASKSYRRAFKLAESAGFENEVIAIVSRILGKRYDAFWFREHSKYRLPHVKSRESVYSGFNMGAGENTLFEIMSTILAAPEGLLVVMDEIELGLHESAQRQMIHELKSLCERRKIQIICTTHSATIIDSIPPEGRFYLDRHGDETIVTTGIAPEYAAGRLGEQNSKELDVFVEDGIARKMVQSVLRTGERRRVNLLPIGSAASVVRQLSARYMLRGAGECVALLDGDQKALLTSHKKYFLANCELSSDNVDATDWFETRLGFLPGNSWPERWITTTLSDHNLEDLASSLGVFEGELRDILEIAANAGKHNEFVTLSNQLSLPVDELSSMICKWIAAAEEDKFANVRALITNNLD